MRDRRELVSFAAVMLVIAAVCITTIGSCGGGGGNPDGELCSQCGDSDGPCIPEVELSGDDLPAFCSGDPCRVTLLCVRKLDSGQRRCFPAKLNTQALDKDFRCDGSRPEAIVTPTSTPTRTATITPSPSITPSATAPTPVATSPSPAQSPADDEATVGITIDDEDGEFTGGFTATVTYPSSKGTFSAGGTLDCEADEGVTVTDNGSGTLTLIVTTGAEDIFPGGATCTFHLNAGQTLVEGEVTGSVKPTSLQIEVDVS